MTIRIEVVYALPRTCYAVELQVDAGTTVADAVGTAMTREPFSSLLASRPSPDPEKVGIFGRVVDPDTPLSDGDRVELYRDLAQDPRDLRRTRAGPGQRR